MIAEALQYLITPTPFEARRFRHLDASISLWSRARRCQKAWADHENRCHRAIGEAIHGLPQRRTVLVLGSGLLRDIDLPTLLRTFEEVILVDLVHLWPTRLKTLGKKKVRLVTTDLAGANEFLSGHSLVLTDPLTRWNKEERIDLVISANMLSQLPLLPLEYGARKRRRDLDNLAQKIIQNHLTGLRTFSCRVCLLTDIEQLRRDPKGTILSRSDLLYGTPLPPPPLSWEWPVAPFGEIEESSERVHRVSAYPDFLQKRN